MKIEKNIPVPENNYPRKKDEFYYLAQKMEIGDSVFFENHKDAQKLKCRLDVMLGKNRTKYPHSIKIITEFDKFNVTVPWTPIRRENNGWRCWFVDGLKIVKQKYGDIND